MNSSRDVAQFNGETGLSFDYINDLLGLRESLKELLNPKSKVWGEIIEELKDFRLPGYRSKYKISDGSNKNIEELEDLIIIINRGLLEINFEEPLEEDKIKQVIELIDKGMLMINPNVEL